MARKRGKDGESKRGGRERTVGGGEAEEGFDLL